MGFWGVVDAVIANSDIVVVVGDARMPELSRHREVERKALKHGKELVIVFTKRDLASAESLHRAKQLFPEDFFVSGVKNEGVRELRRHLQVLGKRIGISEPVVGIVGYPNVGKSALINALARRARTVVTDKPGTTRGVQWVRSGGLRILDSPGVIPYEDRSVKLVLLGSKHPDQIAQPELAALNIVRLFLKEHKDALREKYRLREEDLESEEGVFKALGRKRGFLKHGGEVDEKKTAIQIIRDWQKGKLRL